MHVPGSILMRRHVSPRLFATLGFLALVGVTAIIPVSMANPMSEAGTRFGFTPFPYDTTPEAVAETQKIVESAGNLYALHFDNCIPWQELLDGKPLPRFLQDDWDRLRANIPHGDAVYLGIAPLATDRRTVAPTCGDREGATRKLPRAIRDGHLDNPDLMAAYLRFVQLAVKHFNPDYLNIGIEVDGLAAHAKKDWSRFETLFDYVREEIKREQPDLLLGVSLNPQIVMNDKVGERTKALVEKSDYLGLSFYPYASPFAERFGADPLGEGADRWNRVFDWTSRYTDKPVAICETGFSTQNIHVKQFDLRLEGDIESQTQYVRALVNRADRDDYLFVVWFLAVDYDQLYEKMPEHEGKEVNLLWRNIGLFDGDLNPKPAFAEWQNALAGEFDPDSIPEPAPARTAAAAPAAGGPGIPVGFAETGDLFGCPGDDVALDTENRPDSGGASMRWRYRYGGQWKWCAKQAGDMALDDAESLAVWVRSDKEGPLFLTVEEKGGESFFAILELDEGWQHVRLDLRDLSVDENKRRDGNLDPSRIDKLILADPGPGKGSKHKYRTVWLADFAFQP